MSFTYDTSNNIGKVRAIVGDTTQSSAILSDEQITVFLNLTSSDLFATAAMALRSMAASKAVLAKLKVAGNYTEDTRAIATQLRELAKDLDEASKSIPADAQVELILNDFQFNNIIWNKTLRGEPLDP